MMPQFPHDDDERELERRETEEAQLEHDARIEEMGTWLEEPCRRCGRQVIGALDDRGFGVYIDVGTPFGFRHQMPFATKSTPRHVCPKVRP